MSPLFQLSSNFDGTAARPAYGSRQRHEPRARPAENAGLARLVAGGMARSPQSGSTGRRHEMTSPAGRLSLLPSSLLERTPLMASTNLSLFSPQRTRMGVVLGNGQARVTRREIEQVAAQAEVVAQAEQARAFLTSQVLTNIATLVTQAEAQTRIAPGGAQFYEAIITGYALGAGQRIGQL